MDIYLGIDLGTTILKGIAMDDTGKILAVASKETPMITQQPSWAEQSPEPWWSNTLSIINLLGTKVNMKNVRGIGLSGQMHGLVAYDESMSPLRRAIVWMDKRSSQEVEDILSAIGHAAFYKITGNPIFTGFLLASLLWVKRHERAIYDKIAFVSSPKDYLAFKLTGELKTEPTDALATGAFDYNENTWSDKILEKVGIKKTIFPPIIATTDSYGGVTKRIAQFTGIPQGTPVFGGSDQSMAALGSGLIANGQATIAISTGGQFLVVAKKGQIDAKRRLHTLNHALPGVGLYMAATLTAGFSLKWFKNEINRATDVSYPKYLQEMDTIPPGSDGVFYLPFLAGERSPYFNSNLRAAFLGMSHSHNRLHLTRAILEGVAYSLRDCMNVFEDMHMNIDQTILSGGGAKDAIWRQILTNVINIPTMSINVQEHSPFGAAILAKFAQSGFENLPKFYEKIIQTSDYQYPNEKHVALYNSFYAQYKKHANYLVEVSKSSV